MRDNAWTDKRSNESLPPSKVRSAGSEWWSRGYLPHFDTPHAVQHVTFRLADSLPRQLLAEIDEATKGLEVNHRNLARRKRMEAQMDAGNGCCILRKPEAATLVQDALLYFDGQRCRVLAWVIMPNHVHVLFQEMGGYPVSQLLKSWKSFTGLRLMPLMKAAHPDAEHVWHREYWDRFIRDERHLKTAVDYIHNNPVKAGLAAYPDEWPWSSAGRYADD